MGETAEGTVPPIGHMGSVPMPAEGPTGRVSYSLHLTFSLNKFTNFLCHHPFIDGRNR